jgi:hypothetical protein
MQCKKANKRQDRRREEELYSEAYNAVLFVEIEIMFRRKMSLPSCWSKCKQSLLLAPPSSG